MGRGSWMLLEGAWAGGLNQTEPSRSRRITLKNQKSPPPPNQSILTEPRSSDEIVLILDLLWHLIGPIHPETKKIYTNHKHAKKIFFRMKGNNFALLHTVVGSNDHNKHHTCGDNKNVCNVLQKWHFLYWKGSTPLICPQDIWKQNCYDTLPAIKLLKFCHGWSFVRYFFYNFMKNLH